MLCCAYQLHPVRFVISFTVHGNIGQRLSLFDEPLASETEARSTVAQASRFLCFGAGQCRARLNLNAAFF